ncbi:MAG: TRAP transporter large permease [Thiothrix sp.]|nr:TRAP transporter large permease [Thiothrix sp.]
MSFVAVGILGIALMLALIALRMPVGFAMTTVGLGGIGVVYSWKLGPVIGAAGITPFASANDFIFTAIPLFILMGSIAFRSEISSEMFETARKWVGHWPGGLACSTVATCSGFAAASGSSIATAAALSPLTIPEMRSSGFDDRLATGVVAAGGTLGILIPPSVGLLIYALITDQSIGKLFIAGVLPGLLMTILFVGVIVAWSLFRPDHAPRSRRFSWKERFIALRGVIAITALFLLVMGGIYGGLFTPTEAAAIGASGSMLIALLKRKMTMQLLYDSLKETVQTTCMIFMIIIGAHFFSVFLATTQVPSNLAGFVGALPFSRYVILTIIIVMYLILGCVLDVLAMIVLTVPIVFPAMMALGFDPIWFGVIIVIVMEMALITPPVGMNVFVINATYPDVPLISVFAGVLPFLLAQLILILLLTVFPAIALWLPALMFG